MKERPILFSAPMVRAILAGTKTQTRRVMKPQPEPVPPDVVATMPSRAGKHWVAARSVQAMIDVEDFLQGFDTSVPGCFCPYGKPGDRLWVREAFAPCPVGRSRAVVYRADGDATASGGIRWTPSIHMPRWASRITLEVTDVRVQRLQDISGSDARAEGVERIHCYGPDCPDGEDGCNARGCYGARERFHELWDSINGAGAWGANPWVWALSFRRVAR